MMPAELFLNFTDETGARRRVAVVGSPFGIGRTPENDLQIAHSALSRAHAKIERFGDVFVLSDAGSSNGTSVNGAGLDAPAAIQNGDQILLGGAVGIEVEVVGLAADYYQTDDGDAAAAGNGSMTNQSAAVEQSAAWSSLFFIAPICVVLFLLFAGVLLLAFSGEKSPEPVIVRQNNQNDDEDDPPVNRRKSNGDDSSEEPEETPTPRSNSGGEASNSAPANSGGANNSSSGGDLPSDPAAAELDTVEKNVLQFLRGISGDTNPVLRGKEYALINAKIKTLKTSAALRANLAAAKRASANLQAIAKTQGLRPLFVAAVALLKTGDAGGGLEATANAVAPNLGKFGGSIGTELANDCLLVIAAMEQNEPNLPEKLGALAKQRQVSVTTVRTVWFLRENGKLSDPAYDAVLRFLAIGAIAQNPKDFGVNAEPLIF